MSENDLIGLRFEAEGLRLEPEQCAAFAAATGTPAGQMPHTVAATLTAPVQQRLLHDDRLGIALARTMHTEQRIRMTAPLAVGVDYTAVATVETVREMAGGRMITFVTAVNDPAGVTVVTLHTTLLTAAQDGAEAQSASATATAAKAEAHTQEGGRA